MLNSKNNISKALKRWAIVSALCCIYIPLSAKVSYSSPVHYPITLAGNFGEPRPGHFHGGIDVKTDRREGKPIYAIASGYVYRVKANIDGYGNAIYIRQPDGRTTLYCHLKAFSPKIAAAVARQRHLENSDSCEVYLKASDILVAEGQFIAFSGNSGHSFGPHLHLEIHQTDDWALLDPLDFLASFVRDKTAPEAVAFKVYPQDANSFFTRRNESTIHNFGKEPFEAWGNIGFAIRANDHMDSVPNNLGTRNTILYVDGKLVFSSNVDKVPVAMNPQVEIWGDSAYFNHTGIWFMKSFIEPGNTLPFLTANAQRGIISFNQERDYHLKYVLSDVFGNTTVCEFTVRGRRFNHKNKSSDSI